MSKQKVVYVRRSPIFDPDPSPDPSPSIIVIALCAIGVALAGSTIVSPNLWTNFMIMLKPELKELEEERLKAQEKMMNTLIIVMGIVALIVLVYVFWKWSVKKKERKKAVRSYNKLRRMMLR